MPGEGKGRSRTLSEPEEGWAEGMRLLVMQSRCPWCQKQIENVVSLHDGALTWDCPGECNPL